MLSGCGIINVVGLINGSFCFLDYVSFMKIKGSGVASHFWLCSKVDRSTVLLRVVVFLGSDVVCLRIPFELGIHTCYQVWKYIGFLRF